MHNNLGTRPTSADEDEASPLNQISSSPFQNFHFFASPPASPLPPPSIRHPTTMMASTTSSSSLSSSQTPIRRSFNPQRRSTTEPPGMLQGGPSRSSELSTTLGGGGAGAQTVSGFAFLQAKGSTKKGLRERPGNMTGSFAKVGLDPVFATLKTSL